MSIRWTKTRRLGLERLAAQEYGAGLRVSNNNEGGNLYWQTADWLTQQGFARTWPPIAGDRVAITVRGRDVVNVWERGE